MDLLLTLLVVLTISYLTSNIAVKRGRDRTGWFILGFIFGIFALLTVYILPPLNKKEEEKPGVQASDLVPSRPVDRFAEHRWHYIDVNGKQKGPVDFLDIQIAWDDGLLKSDSYLWHEGMVEWERISDIAGLDVKLNSEPGQ